MSVKFSFSQLKEIEKVFDSQAASTAKYFAEIIKDIDALKTKKSQEACAKLLGEAMETFEAYRTISTVASMMQEELAKEYAHEKKEARD